jgi:hypothetical protein
LPKPIADEYKIEQFAKYFRLNYKKEADGSFIVDAFEVWSPNHEDNDTNLWCLFAGVTISNYPHAPDDVDIIDLGEFSSLDDCLIELIKNVGKQVLDSDMIVYAMTPDGEFGDNAP